MRNETMTSDEVKAVDNQEFATLCKDRDLLKYKRLFKMSPASIKTATVFILIHLAIILFFYFEGGSSGKRNLWNFCLLIYLLSGILKASNKCRWVLTTLKALVFLLFIYAVCIGWSSGVKTTDEFHFVLAWSAALDTALSLPYVIALFMPSANRWFREHKKA